MSKFYGSIEGSAKTTATRCGTKNSGIESHTRGWNLLAIEAVGRYTNHTYSEERKNGASTQLLYK